MKIKCDITDKIIDINHKYTGLAYCYTKQQWLCGDLREINEESGIYPVSLYEIQSPERMIDLLAQLSTKPWFDSNEFFSFCLKLRGKLSQ